MRLIDADELKEAMEEHTDYKGYLVCAPEEVIDLAPTVEARPHGEWIRNDNGTYSCNVCHSWIPEEQHYYARYCLHCGRTMSRGGDK